MGSFEALLATLLGVVPGALYTWESEKQAGAWGVTMSDRVLRFLGVSVLFHLLLAPLTWWLVQQDRHGPFRTEASPWLLWPVLAVYALLPAALGHAVGVATRRRRPWARWLTGPAPAPRAWDQVFSYESSVWLRIRLKDPGGGANGWLAGAFAPATRGPDSYASGFPHDQDLFLAETVEVDPESGLIRLLEGRPKFRGVGVLMRWEEVAYAEVMCVEGE
ncbi:DUF6338 family protein [Streptomyces sp. NPDC008150]|uniref:DUF6338 family protein n=1 Tax=Streptomyces sp. NPDC008150 TaxID=3364816 RepID=UPI0036EF4BF1